MDAVNIDRVSDDLANALEQVRIGLQSNLERAEVLDRFWCLQDQVSRLVESASDHPHETLYALTRRHPRLFQKIIDVLSLADSLHFTDTSAINAATLAINRSLSKLEYLREAAKVEVASA